MCLSHLIYIVRPCLIHTCHAAPMPCCDHAVALRRTVWQGTPWAWHGHGMLCMNWPLTTLFFFTRSQSLTLFAHLVLFLFAVIHLHSSPHTHTHTLKHCLLFSHTESVHTISPSLKNRHSFQLILWQAFIISAHSVIGVYHFRLFSSRRLSFLTHSPTTPVLHPNINLLFLKRFHPLLFIIIHSSPHPYLLTLTLTQIENLSHSYACTTIPIIHYFPLPAQLVRPFC